MTWTAVLRIFMLITQAWAYRISVTPPNPPPPKTDQHHHGDTMMLPIYWNRWVWDSLYYSTTLIEVVAIVLPWLPSDFYASYMNIMGTQTILQQIYELTGGGRIPLSIPPEAIVGWILTILGTLLRVWCYKALAKAFTFELSLKEDHKLIRSGPYAYIRHPSYTGLYAVIIGSAMLTYGRGSWWWQVGFGLGSWRYLAVIHLVWEAMMMHVFLGRTKLEDKVLRDHFKEEWEQWERNVPCRLVPRVY
ncbi:hypothetical protein BDY19DRAFT_989609 [Irpex rosettiformis]|uniref:Uncharacterized protein n=1 Tax=Irpex rosettiformis TaxID=378272 RepID=A0ACB8UIT1_9APHY|nr:hypothetical protein BDY19DRAFT_989609 [Irpex rosettiformis]